MDENCSIQTVSPFLSAVPGAYWPRPMPTFGTGDADERSVVAAGIKQSCERLERSVTTACRVALDANIQKKN